MALLKLYKVVYLEITNLTVTSRGDDTRNILKIVTQSDTNGNLTFDILATNSTGYAARLTQDNLTGIPIIIDTLPPALTLNGNNDTISALGRPYTDLNATAYDISYGSKTIAPTGCFQIEGNLIQVLREITRLSLNTASK